MSSRFNIIFLGDPERAAEELSFGVATNEELNAGLVNAFRLIAALQAEVRGLREQIGPAGE